MTIAEGADGVINGSEKGGNDEYEIENGRRVGNVLAWEYKASNCVTYQVRMEIQDDGRTMNGVDRTKDRCEKPPEYYGKYVNYRKL